MSQSKLSNTALVAQTSAFQPSGDASHTPQRRAFLKGLGSLALATSAVSLLGCGRSAETTGTETTTSSSTGSTGSTGGSGTITPGQCVLIPEETAGPYPLSSVLSNTALIRSNITESRDGVPLTIQLKIQDYSSSCAPASGIVVYLWHCDKDGLYSGYNQPGGNTLGQTFMRGIQTSDSEGLVTFKTIYPGWYSGRITHVHFQVFRQSATGTLIATSQFAFPAEVTTAVYNSTLYSGRGQNTSVRSFSEDNVFNDSTEYQMPTLSGNVADGYVATLVVNIPV